MGFSLGLASSANLATEILQVFGRLNVDAVNGFRGAFAQD